MPNNNESTRWLYGQLSRRGYNVGKDLAEFENLMQTNSESRKWAYDTARGEGLDVGRDQAEFDSLVAPDSAAGAGYPSAGSHARQVVEEYDESVGRNDGDTGIDSADVKPTEAKTSGIVLPDGFGRLDTRHFTDNKGMYRAGWDEKSDLFDGPTAVEQTVRALNGDRGAMRQEKPAMDSMNAQLRDRLDYMRETGKELKDPVVDMTQFGIAPSLDRFEGGELRMVDGKPIVGHVNDEVRAGTQRIDSERLRRADLQRQLEEAEKELAALNNEAEKISSPGYIYGQDALSPYADPRTTDGDLASLSTAMKQTQERIDGLKRQLSGGNTTIMRGIADGLADVDMWTLGLTSLGEGMNMARVAKQIRGGHEADSAEALMIDAIIKNGDVQQALEENSTMGYRGARMFGQMLPFMGQIMATGGFGGVADLGTAAGRRWAMDYIKKHGAEAFRNRMAANILKGTGVALGDIAAGFANATTLGIGNTVNDALQRYTGQAVVDETGDYTFAGGDELWRAFGKALTSQTKEFATERFGEHLPGVGQIGGWIGRLPKMSMVSRAMSGLAGNKVMRKTSEWLRKGGINGLGSEIMEEEIGLPIDVALGDMTWDEAFSGRTQGDIVFGLAMSVGAMQGIGAAAQGIGKLYNTAQYQRYKKRTDDAGKTASFRLAEDAWTPLKEKIDNTPNEGFGEVWDEVRGNESLSEQEKRAVYDYMNSLAMMRGYALGGLNGIKEKARRDAFLSSEEQQNVHEDGMIHAAVMFPNADNGGQQQEVFVVKGNVVLREDGTVDVDASDDVIYYKGADGQTHSASPDKFESVSEPVSIEEYAQAKQVAGDGEAVGAESQAESFAVGQEVSVIVDGVARPATVQGFDGNGNVNVYYQDADGMDRPAVFTEEELRGMNGNAENFQRNGEESMGNGNNGGENIGSADLSIPQNGNIEPQNIPASTETLQADGETLQEPLQVGAGGQSALERIPVDEKGRVLYHEVPVERTIEDLYDGQLNDEEIRGFVDANINDAEKEYNAVLKKAPKISTDKAKYVADKKAWQANVDAVRQKANYWREVKNEMERLTHTSQEEVQAARRELSGEASHEEYSQISDRGGQPGSGVELAAYFVSGAKITPESFKRETGYGTDEQRKFVGMIASAANGGKSIESIAENLVEHDNTYHGGTFFQGDSMAARDAIISALQSAQSRSGLKKLMPDAEREFVESREQEREEYYQEAFHMSYEEYLAYSEQEMPELLRKYSNFDEQKYLSLYGEEIERNITQGKDDTTREEQRTDRGTEILPREGIGDQGGSRGGQERAGEVQTGRDGSDAYAALQESASGGITGSDGLRNNERGGAEVRAEARQGDLAQGEIRLSDEIDANGRQFVLTSDGQLAFGEITEKSGLTPAPILLSEGMITNPATNDGYGLVHIEARHGNQIRNAGYKSVVEFIEDVVKNYDRIKEGNVRNGNATYLMQLTDKHNNTLIVELSSDGTYWNINTAGIFKESYGKNRKVVYDRHTTGKQPAETAGASQEAAQSGTPTSPSMNAPTTSESSLRKDTDKSSATQAIGEKVAKAEEETDTNPTEAQKEAGNYRKGHVRIGQFDITVENPKGSVRRGVDADGKAWEHTMRNTYGYIRGTEGVDGDHIDVFLTNDIDGWSGRRVYVVDQYNEDGTFDEHKVMLGFNDEAEAQDAYLSNYEKGWSFKRKLVMSSANLEDFEKWINSSHRKTKPFAEYKSVSRENDGNRVTTRENDLAARVRETLREIRKPKMVEVISGEDDLALRASYLPPNTISKVRQAINDGAIGYYDIDSDVIFMMSDMMSGDVDVRRLIYHEHIHSALSALRVNIDDALAALREERPDLLAEATRRVGNTALYDGIDSDVRNEEIFVYAIDHLVADGVVMDGDGKFTEIYNNIFNALRNGKNKSLVRGATRPAQGKGVSPIRPMGESGRHGQGESHGLAREAEYGGGSAQNDGGRRESKFKTLRNGKEESLVRGATRPAQENRAPTVQPVRKPRGERQGNSLGVAGEAEPGGSRPLDFGGRRESQGKRGEAVDDARQLSLDDIKSVNDGDVVFAKPTVPATDGTQEAGHVWQYSVSVDKTTGRTTVRRDDVSGPVPIGDARFTIHADSPQEMLAILRNPKNGMQEVLDAVGITLENKANILAIVHGENAAQPQRVDIEGVATALREKGSAKLSNHIVSQQETADSYGASNKLVSRERYEELKARMRRKLGGQLNMGIDPEILAIGTEMAAYHIEAGARKFADYASHMIADLGDAIRPYLKSFYNGARDLPEVQETGLANEMTPYEEVHTFDVANFDKQSINPLDTARTIAREQEAVQQAEVAKNRLKNNRNSQRKESQSKKKAVSSQVQTPDLFGEEEYAETPRDANNVLHRKFAMAVKDDMLAALDNDMKPYRSILDLRKRASGLGMEVDNDGRTDILLQELVEDGLVRAAREVAERHGSDSRETYDIICKLYEMQPTIAARSSNRIKMQQYSTPLPMAWNAARFVMTGKKDGKVLEPTAGNGMLVFAIPAEQVHANELDGTRLANLREQGFAQVTRQDATEPFEGGKQYDVVIANPPFGKREAVDYDGKPISGLDPQITLNALASMKDDGRAAIIIGGNMEYAKNGAINNMKPFFTYLYDHYNVKGVVDMDGSLYAKQGTTYPTRMILIDGRRSDEERAQSAVYPPVQSKAIRKADSFEALYDIIDEVINSKDKTNGTEILRERRPLRPVAGRPRGNVDKGGREGQPAEGNRPIERVRGGLDSRLEDVLGEQDGNDTRNRRKLAGGRGRDRELGGHPDQRMGMEGRPSPVSSQQGGSGRTADTAGRGGERVRGGRERLLDTQLHPDGNTGDGSRSVLKNEPKRQLDTEKLPYRPHNSAFSLESVAPAAMVEAMDRTLSQIEKKHGNIDEFVRKELGYGTTDELHQALAAEQVDSVAMAIYQMKQRQALIIGDQTGVGKGRQMAALIRWAVRQGEKPIFITQKADLFSDIYRDLVDIGSGDLVPFIFNDPSGKENRGEMVDANGKVVYKALSDAKMKKVLATGKLPDECDYAVLTYSQVNTGDEISRKEAAEAAKKSGKRGKKSKDDGKITPKAPFLRSIAKDNYLFLDESHTAAGEGKTGAFMQSILRDVKAATFASATFAKRPDTMPLYAIRTAMSQAKVEPDKLISIIEKGGVTLQEIMSRELTNAGQMVRRERDMSDVVTDWETIDDPETVRRARENYDRTIAAFNAIIKFQEDYVKPMVDAMDKELAEMAASAGIKRGTNKMGVDNVPFASKTYNYTKQLMLALKADAIADKVDSEIKAGRHPVIALESTMESSIDEYAAGEVVAEPTFGANLLKGLDSVMQYTIKDENGKQQHARYSPKQLGEAGEKAYYELQDFIRESTSDIFISPIDAIIERLHEMGYKVGELTGRDKYVELDNEGRAVVRKRTDKDKKRMQREFNNGKLDVLILNKSASTGISLHASEKFSDQRQRTMVIAQPLSDINDYMQMIGRIDRTGQVHRGYYINLGLPVPAENRFLMMLSTKLKSLNANTTTSQDSESNEVEAPDLLNKYGSQVVVEYLRDNPDIYDKMGTPLKKGGKGGGRVQTSELDDYKPQEDDARKITGYVALLTTQEQEEFYDDVVRRYNELIKYLNDTGNNDLKITVMPLRAKTLEKRVSSEGIDPVGANPFAQNSYVEQVEMDVLRKPMKAAEIRKTIEQVNKGKRPEDYIRQVISTIEKEDEARIAAEEARYERSKVRAQEDIAKQTEKINRQQKRSAEEKQAAIADYVKETNENVETKHSDNLMRLNTNSDMLKQRLHMFDVGMSYLMPDNLETQMFDFYTPAIFCGYKAKDSKVTASTTLAVFATLDGRRRVEVKLSDIAALRSIYKTTNDNWDAARSTTLENWDSQIPTGTRKTGYIMTGNILQAIADTQDERGGFPGQLISYTDIDGNVHDGILMPDKWNRSMLKTSGAPIISRIKQIKDYMPVTSHDGKVEIMGSSWAKMYYLTVPKTKKDGAVFYQNEELLHSVNGGNFYPYRGKLRADIPAEHIESVVEELSKLGVKVQEEAKEDDVLYRNGYELSKVNERFNEQLDGLTETNADKVVLSLGKPSAILRAAGVEDKPMKLYGNKVIKNMKKHGFKLDELHNLPEAVASPIAVFNNYQKDGNCSILTELRTSNGNFLVTVDLGKDADVDFNIVTSVFGKGDNNIVNWINKGYATYIDKEKAQEFLFHQSAPIAATAANSELISAANIVKNFENPNVSDENLRLGNGVLTDDDLANANDPVSKLLGKSTRTARQRRAFAERERVLMVERVQELVETLHLDNVDIVTDASTLQGNRAKAKGFYSRSTGRITIVIPNQTSVFDAEQTLLHEAVAHYGLRELFGEHFDTFLDNVFQNADTDVRRHIVELAERRGWDFRTATEEYLASLAENTNFENTNASWWSKIKELFLRMLHKIGFEDFSGVTLSDNELRYILWRSYENLAEPGRYRSIIGTARDISRQHALGVGNYAANTSGRQADAAADMAGEPSVEEVNRQFNEELEQQIAGDLPDGHIYGMGMPSNVLLSTGVPNFPIQMNANRLQSKATSYGHDFDLTEVKDLVKALQHPLAVFAYGDKTKAQNIIVSLQKDGKNFIVGLSLNPAVGGRKLEINSIRNVFPKNNAEWLNWITQGKALYLNKEKLQDLIDQQRTILADVEYLDLDSAANIVKNFENPRIEDENISLTTANAPDAAADMAGEPSVEEVNRRFNEELNMFEKGEMRSSDKFSLGKPSRILQAAGLPNSEIGMTQSVLRTHLKKHGLKNQDLQGLPIALQHPTMVYEWGNKAKSAVVITDMELPDGRRITIAIKVAKNGERLSVNEIASVHGKDLERLLTEMNTNKTDFGKDNLKYVDKDKALHWFAMASPLEASQTDTRLVSAANIVKNFENPSVEDGNVLYRDGNSADVTKTSPEESTIRAWDKIANSVKFQLTETGFDYLNAVDKFQKLISKRSGKSVTDFENAYDAMTFLSSKNRQEMDMFDSFILSPLNKAIIGLVGKRVGRRKNWNWDKGPLRELVMYVEAKHGMERNRQMAVEAVAKADPQNADAIMARWNEAKKQIKEQRGTGWAEKQRLLDEAAASLGADLGQDYSGLSSVFKDKKKYPQGWSKAALDYVESYELSHPVKAIDDLWRAIGNATGFTLQKQFETGLVSREYVESQKERFENYIPLRGFEDDTAGDVYNYIGQDYYPGSNPVKTAHGRTSEPGNPFGSILNTAYASISSGNKNVAKTAFYTLVMNHDTGGLAVARKAWMVKYSELKANPELESLVVVPKFDNDEDIPEWIEAVPRIPEKGTAEEISRVLGEFDSVMKKYEKAETTKPINKKAKTAYRTLYKERNEHEIPLFIGGSKYVVTITGNPRVAQAMNGLLNPDSGEENLIKDFYKRTHRFMSGAFTAKNAAFSLANLFKDTMYANNQTFIRENPKYWLLFTKNQRLGFGDFIPMMRRLHRYRRGQLSMESKTDRLFKEFMDNGGATGYTFVNTQEEYAKELEKKLRELSKGKARWFTPKAAFKLLFDCFEFAGQAAELVNRFAAYKTSREMGRSINRGIRDAKEITVNFNRKGAGRKTASDNNSTIVNLAAAVSQYGRTNILFWNANMQAKYRFFKNMQEHPVKTSVTLIANNMALGGIVIPMLNNMVLPALYSAFGDGDDGEDAEDYFNALTDYERTHNICIRLPRGYWLKIPLSPEMSTWYSIGDAVGGAVSGQMDLQASDFIQPAIDAVSPLSINWQFWGDWKFFLNLLPTVGQPLAQDMMNVNFMGNPIRKTPLGAKQGKQPEYTLVYRSASPTLIELSRLSNRLAGGEDDKTAGVADWNPAMIQNLISGYMGGFGTTMLSVADWMVNTAKGEKQAVTFSRMPLVSRFAISGDKDMQLRRINSRFYDVKDFVTDFEYDMGRYADRVEQGKKEHDSLKVAAGMAEYNKLLESDRAAKYTELVEIADSVDAYEKYLKEFPDDEATKNLLYQIKLHGIEVLRNGAVSR